jgi:hypothetical protein
MVGVGMAEFVEYVDSLFPDFTGGIVVADGVEGIAEAAEGVGFAVPVDDVPAQVDGALVAGGRLLVLAEVVGVAEAVPGWRLGTRGHRSPVTR